MHFGVFVVVWALVAACKLLVAVASVVARHGLQSAGLNTCGLWA